MMNTIVNEELISFKELEQKIYSYVCESQLMCWSPMIKNWQKLETENSTEFHAKREACIRKKYAADEINQRILNGDGGSWIKEPYEPDTIFQLDR